MQLKDASRLYLTRPSPPQPQLSRSVGTWSIQVQPKLVLPGCSFPKIWGLEAMARSLQNTWLSPISRKHNQGETQSLCWWGLGSTRSLFQDFQPTAGWVGSSLSLGQSKYLGPVHRVAFPFFFSMKNGVFYFLCIKVTCKFLCAFACFPRGRGCL